MTLLGSLTMVLTVSGIVSGVLLTSLEKRFTLKGILYFDAAIFYAVAVSAAIAAAFGRDLRRSGIIFGERRGARGQASILESFRPRK